MWSMRMAVVGVALVTAPGQPLYVLDPSWPTVPPQYTLAQITAVAVANGSSGGTEVHVAQRGYGAPPVLVFDTTGALLRTWGSNATIVSIHGMKAQTGTPSTLWLTDIANVTVKQFTSTGTLLTTIGTPGQPGDGVDPPQFSAPADIAITPGLHVLVADGDGGDDNRVLDLSPGTWTVYYGVGGAGNGPSQFSSPHSVTYDPVTSTFFVADRGNARIQQFDAATGLWLQQWDTCFSPWIPWGVRLDWARGRLVMADGQNNVVTVLHLDYTNQPTNPGVSGNCTVLQTWQVGNNTKPHEVDVDMVTGDFYLAGVGTVPTLQRYVRKA